MIKKETFSLIFQIIQIIAIGYLVFKILQPTGASERLDQIEKNQLIIKNLADSIIIGNQKAYIKYDSTDKVRLKKIDSLNNNINTSINQIRGINKNIKDWTNVFKENKVTLPDPDR